MKFYTTNLKWLKKLRNWLSIGLGVKRSPRRRELRWCEIRDIRGGDVWDRHVELVRVNWRKKVERHRDLCSRDSKNVCKQTCGNLAQITQSGRLTHGSTSSSSKRFRILKHDFRSPSTEKAYLYLFLLSC